MIGIGVNRESLLRFLQQSIDELIQQVQDAAKAQKTVGCAHLGNFERWVREREWRLAHLEELLALAERSLKPGAVLREAEVEAKAGGVR